MKNPKAFPSIESIMGEHSTVKGTLQKIGSKEHKGMTLKDYFAGQALINHPNHSYRNDIIAKDCYNLADAMLKEREKGGLNNE